MSDPDRLATFPHLRVEILLVGETTEAVARRWVAERFSDLTPVVEIYESFYRHQPATLIMRAEGPILWDPELPPPPVVNPRDLPERLHGHPQR